MFGNDKVAVVGDPTNVGGQILKGASMFDIDGAPVAVQGSAVLCGLCGPTKIAKGSSHVYIMGVPVALHGDPLLCGHTINVMGRRRMSSSKSSEGPGRSRDDENHTDGAVSDGEPMTMASGFDQRLEIRHSDGTPYSGAAFVKAVHGMPPLEGTLSSDGMSPPIKSTQSGTVLYGIAAPQARAS